MKDEYFIEVDPRTSRVAGYHKYQDEKRPGPRLEQPQALAIAQARVRALRRRRRARSI